MKQVELNKMGLTQIPLKELSHLNGGSSFAHDCGTAIRWLYIFASNGGSFHAQQIAELDRNFHKIMNSQK